MYTQVCIAVVGIVSLTGALAAQPGAAGPQNAATAPAASQPAVTAGQSEGIAVVLGLDKPGIGQRLVDLARTTRWVYYFQSPDRGEVAAVRQAASQAGLLGRRIFADHGELSSIHLADNLVDAVLAPAEAKTTRQEFLRVLRLGGQATIGQAKLVKPFPPGIDAWTHPYHGPDNNPRSSDQLARAPYLTQFLTEPAFGCIPEVTVVAGGRVFRAFGHIAFRQYQNAVLGTLLAVNASNGTILWRRPLRQGFMIHRNTMIATPETLYLGDDQACKLIDAASGRVKGQILALAELSDGPTWKWMALDGGTLYALVGASEFAPPVQKGREATLSGWPWSVWPGFDYAEPKTAFGFGRTFAAFEADSGRLLWHHREEDYVDSRGTCMRNGRIYFYTPGKSLACLETKTGMVLWRSSAPDLMAAIGPTGKAQLFKTGFASSTYIKCNDKALFLAGPQRPNLVAVAADTGKLLWQRKDGNLQLVLGEDGLYAAGEQGGASFKLDYDTGRELARFTDRRACTRATGNIDSLFFRAKDGTVRLAMPGGDVEHIAPMRPPCHSGVITSEGLLHWGPWICDCNLSLFGHIALAPAGKFDFHPKIDDSRLQAGEADAGKVEPLDVTAADWACHRPDYTTTVAVGQAVERSWVYQPTSPGLATPPVAAGDLVFVGGQDGVVRALEADSGKPRWQAVTGGAIKSAPAVWNGRVYAGSCDGWVYAFEARTGRQLWRFRLAPAERWIPVFERLQSTWPVAGGVAVADGVVYAAAGFAHYDGTYVAALDALTGRVKWSNDTSGTMSKVKSGVSPQGPLAIVDGKLCFAGGNVHALAQFDPKSGECLTAPVNTPNSRAQTRFYLPDGICKVVKQGFGGGLSVTADHVAGRLTIAPAPAQAPPNPFAIYRGFALADRRLLAAGSSPGTPGRPESSGLAAIDVNDGSKTWQVGLPADVVPSGIAVTRHGQVIVSLVDGSVVCFAGPKGSR